MDAFDGAAIVEALDRIANAAERLASCASAICEQLESIECDLSALSDVVSYPSDGAKAVLAVSTGD